MLEETQAGILAEDANPTVDFLSLDIEGAEFQVLRTIPWDKGDIRALSAETQFAGYIHMSSKARRETSSTCSQALASLSSARLPETTYSSVYLELGGQRRQKDRCPCD